MWAKILKNIAMMCNKVPSKICLVQKNYKTKLDLGKQQGKREGQWPCIPRELKQFDNAEWLVPIKINLGN